jgi:regulator of sigma E protease
MRPTELDESFGDLFIETPLHLTIDPTQATPGTGVGWGPAGMCVYSIQPGSPAAEAGLQRGDEILTVGGRRYNVFSSLLGQLQQKHGESLALTFRRDGVEQQTTITPEQLTVTGDFNQGVTETFVGMASLTTAENYPHAYNHFPLLEMTFGERLSYGFSTGFKALLGFIVGIIVGVWQLISGQVGLDNLGGPLMIFDIAARAGSAGAAPFLRIMALISINLGILNLLPIPVLDGGNLLLFAIEAVKRGPITMRTRQIANYIGLVFIITIFILVFKNDIERYWHHVAEFFD